MWNWLMALFIGSIGIILFIYVQNAKVIESNKKNMQDIQQQSTPNHETKHKSKVKHHSKVDHVAEKLMKQKQKGPHEVTCSNNDHSSLKLLLQGHKYGITSIAYSPNNRFLATSSTDRTIRLYLRDRMKGNEKTMKPHIIQLEYDHATAMTFSCDGRTLVIATVNGLVKIYQKLKLKPELVSEFSISHKTDVHSIVMNDIGNFATIITCAKDSDTEIKCWSVTGELLQIVNTNQVINYKCLGSIDNRYLAVAAYTPEVKIFELLREKNGMFKKLQKVMTLRGDRTGIWDLTFNGSDTKPVNQVITISKDGSVRFWNINVRYQVNEDPKCIKTIQIKDYFPTINWDDSRSLIQLSPNGNTFIFAKDSQLSFFSTIEDKEILTIQNAMDTKIHHCSFSPDGKEVLVQGTKMIKIYHTT